jgi:hypothetical protein
MIWMKSFIMRENTGSNMCGCIWCMYMYDDSTAHHTYLCAPTKHALFNILLKGVSFSFSSSLINLLSCTHSSTLTRKHDQASEYDKNNGKPVSRIPLSNFPVPAPAPVVFAWVVLTTIRYTEIIERTIKMKM